jgi:hypothetical protein
MTENNMTTKEETEVTNKGCGIDNVYAFRGRMYFYWINNVAAIKLY